MVYTIEKPSTFTLPRRRFTREEYYRMAEMGLFDGERVELIEGDIVRMSPVSPLHGEIVTLIAEKLWTLFGRGYRVRVQQPLAIGDSEPNPISPSCPANPVTTARRIRPLPYWWWMLHKPLRNTTAR